MEDRHGQGAGHKRQSKVDWGRCRARSVDRRGSNHVLSSSSVVESSVVERPEAPVYAMLRARTPSAPDIICHTQTPAALGANTTARGLSNRNSVRGATPAQRLPYTSGMRRGALPIAALMALSASPGATPPPAVADGPLIQRAKSFELNTPYVPPPGDPLEHHAAGYAKVMCSAVFITGLDPDFAAANVGFFTGPYEERGRLGKPAIDRTARTVTITLPNGVRRTARY